MAASPIRSGLRLIAATRFFLITNLYKKFTTQKDGTSIILWKKIKRVIGNV
ncbi:hypothetical protein [Acinetobacter sp. ANC 3903]|uniref:hypothetical protein n=1 Tax=Acinetobacter sp. ANC 3903 TaxID=1977883 RepID=UPI00148A4783|nr:hypothetical protein [Acinetobacter sp. ANC 3903]